jgi:predicted AAA+ superfamily ATPase
VTRYLEYLEATFVTHRLNPFFTNPRSELSKMPKIYFTDPGLRNLALGFLGNERLSRGSGPTLEGMVLNALVHQYPYTRRVNFWRSTSRAEVDFVIAGVRPETCIEVKAGEMKSIKLTRGYRSFLEKYHPSRALLLSRDLWEDVQVENIKVEAMPIAVFLAQKSN